MAEQQASHGSPQQLEEIEHGGGRPQPWRKARYGLAPAMHPSALTHRAQTASEGRGPAHFLDEEGWAQKEKSPRTNGPGSQAGSGIRLLGYL